MTIRQNDWTLGAYCSRYCTTVTSHHTREDVAIFPHLRRADPALAPVLDRLDAEHLVIHDVLEELDKALIGLVQDPTAFGPIDDAIASLSDTLLSHLAYEERELIEPLVRLGLYDDQF
jgi:hemerythrin-like domain-containing protein